MHQLSSSFEFSRWWCCVKWMGVSLEEAAFRGIGDCLGVFCLCLRSRHFSAVLANRVCVLVE